MQQQEDLGGGNRLRLRVQHQHRSCLGRPEGQAGAGCPGRRAQDSLCLPRLSHEPWAGQQLLSPDRAR